MSDVPIPEDIMIAARAVADAICPALPPDERAAFVAAKWPIVARALMGERERCAVAVDDFHWTLPLYGDRPSGFTAADVNMLTDDCACSVQEQIAASIRRGTP